MNKSVNQRFRVNKVPYSDQLFGSLLNENLIYLNNPNAKKYNKILEASRKLGVQAHRQKSMATPWMDYIKKTGREVMVDTDFVRWDLKYKSSYRIRMKGVSPMTDVTHPGIQGGNVRIRLSTDRLKPGDRIMATDAKENQLVIQAGPFVSGTYWEYDSHISTTSRKTFYPKDLLKDNTEYVHNGSFYGEGSSGFGSVQIFNDTVIEFQNWLNDTGYEYEVTNKAQGIKYVITELDDDGNPIDQPKLLVDDYETQFQAYVGKQEELIMYYGRAAQKQILDPTSDTYRRIGAGFEEFMSEGHDYEYPINGGGIEMFVEFIRMCQFDNHAPEGAEWVFGTGTVGKGRFHEWVLRKYGDSAIIRDKDFYVKDDTGYPTGVNNYSFPNHYFTAYNIPDINAVVRIEYWDFLDNRDLNTLNDPTTGLPETSGHFVCLNYGNMAGADANIYVARRRGTDIYQVLCGTWSPDGGINEVTSKKWNFGASPKRGYEVRKGMVSGMFVRDIDYIIRFRPAVSR